MPRRRSTLFSRPLALSPLSLSPLRPSLPVDGIARSVLPERATPEGKGGHASRFSTWEETEHDCTLTFFSFVLLGRRVANEEEINDFP